MFIKLIMIAVIAVGTIMLFSSEISEYFPNTATSGMDSFKQDVSSAASKILESAEQRVDSSSQTVKTQLSTTTAFEQASDEIGNITGDIRDKLMGFFDASTEFVDQNISATLQSVSGTQTPQS